MSNPSKAKGTRYEVELLAKLRDVFGPQVERSPLKGILDAGDYVGVPIPIEAKNTKVLMVPDWIRRLHILGEDRFALFYSGGDRRLKWSPGELMIVPADFGLYLLQLYAKAEGRCTEPTR